MSAAMAPTHRGGTDPARAARTGSVPVGAVVPRIVARLAAIGALAAFGAQAWAEMVRPQADGRMLGAAAVAVALAAAAILASRLSVWPRRVVLAAVPFLGAAAALLLAGVPLHMLDRESWGDLASGLGQGISALPGLNVPYRGVDEWNRIAMLLGGTLAAVAGVLIACWPLGGGRYGRPAAGVVLLAVLYAVPAVQLDADHPWFEGLVFALLLAAALRGERLAAREAPLAFVVVLLAALVSLALAPRLDARDPWLDYESFAQSLGERGTSSFSWEHGYGPLDWPRDGREVLRIRAPTGSYWKATTLTEFDGVRWRETSPRGLLDDPAAERPREKWVQELQVSVRNLSTRQFVSAGTTLRIDRSPREVTEGQPGSFVTTGRPLRRGHAYLAKAYVPRPRTLEIESAGSDYPTSMWPFLSMRLPESVGGPPPIDAATQAYDPDAAPAFVVFSGFDDPKRALGFLAGRGFGERVGTRWVRESSYARMFELAQRLRAGADTPYAFVRAVQNYFGDDFTYSETPSERPLPLDAFVFEDKVGYCQQFSGAMALLLRMGGVPARVASGFSPGTLDAARNEYVVRDLDAHSWVEVFFPGYGWIPFDPTPAVAPARAQLPALDEEAEGAAEEETGSSAATRGSERAQDPNALGQEAAAEEGGTSAWAIAGGALLVLAVLAAALYALLARRWRARYGPEVAARELATALRRTGRAPRPGATLSQIEETFRWAPEAAGYVHRVRAARFGFGAEAPSREQRRALRRELGSGLGLRGRLRALWALPPF